MSKKYSIGITISVDDYNAVSLFSNGIRQNVILLQEVYEKCKNIKKSYIINTANSKTPIEGTAWEKYKHLIINKTDAEKKCDIIVVCQGSLHPSEYQKYKQLGKKIVKQILGAELAILNERCLFNVPAGGIYKRNNFVDAIWISPHFYKRDRHFFEAVYNGAKTREGPYVWDPRFIEAHVDLFKSKNPDFLGVYSPKEKKTKRISTMEANLNIVKTCIFPIIIAELLERKHPDLIEFFSVFGGDIVKGKPDMIDLVKDFNINKNKKCFFESRYPAVWTLFNHTDIVLSHQNQCELNYLYLDAAWLGFPVVHNSPMMKELGWYFPENEAEEAIKHIKYIADNFDDKDHKNGEYLKKSREYASAFLPSNPKNISIYEDLLDEVIK